MNFEPQLTSVEKAEKAIAGTTFGFGFHALTTLQNAFTYALGLLTYELITTSAKQEWSNSKFFSWLIFMFLTFMIPRVKEMYIALWRKSALGRTVTPNGDDEENVDVVKSMVNSAGKGSSHHFYHVSR